MATNVFAVQAGMSGTVFPLRGDMGASLNFTPDNHFAVSFYTYDTAVFTIISDAAQFRQLDGTSGPTFTFGGATALFVKFMYDVALDLWIPVSHNLKGTGSGGSGSGAPGAPGRAATVSIGTYQQVAYNQPLLITDSGTFTDAILNFQIPGPAPGLPPGGAPGQIVMKTGTNDYQAGWVNAPSGSGGTGTTAAIVPEALLTQASDGTFTPNKLQGNNFRVLLTQNGKIMNPVGYTPGETITISVRQGANAPFTLDFDLNYGLPDRQVPVLSNQPGGVNKIVAYLSDVIDVNNPALWETDVTPIKSNIGYGAPSFIARNTTRNIGYYYLRSGSVPANQCGTTDMRSGETLKILRNGYGIEAYGSIEGPINGSGGTFLISGAMTNGKRAELHTGPGVRTAFDRGVMAVGADCTVTIQDIILSGAREQSGTAHSARGVSLTGNGHCILRNVTLQDNENGILSGNIGNANPADDYTGTLDMFDCEFIANGVGDNGLTHNIYMGHNNQTWTATRCTFRDAQLGHNVKSRQGNAVLTQCLITNSRTARELELPNGGQLHMTDCDVRHPSDGAQDDCIRIGAEGIDTTRPREYIIRNTHLQNDKDPATQASFVWNQDPDVDVQVIDCTFSSPHPSGHQWAGSDANGMVGRVTVSFTGGPVGPRATPGRVDIPVTNV